jgi:hypothetical protein
MYAHRYGSEIRGKDASDTKLLPALVDATAANFKPREVSADNTSRHPVLSVRLKPPAQDRWSGQSSAEAR